ncbi:NYN domain-containing protein, partial [Xanthomonas graminis]|uniref:NYN domain-containing protein n=1 Tax=Xanthomonas graminis TaxID=3390026 RepID=UPI0012DA7975
TANYGCKVSRKAGAIQPRTIEVIKTEEKGSDCNLAAHLVHDACRGAFDVALVISNDSDLAEAIRLARGTGRPVGVANPMAYTSRKMNYELYKAASFTRRIEAKHLKAAQMPNQVGQVFKPDAW